MNLKSEELITDYRLNEISNGVNIISCPVGDIDNFNKDCVLICVGSDGGILRKGVVKKHINPAANVMFKLDYHIKEKHIFPKNIKKIFAANVDVKHDKIEILPRGLSNFRFKHYSDVESTIIKLNQLDLKNKKMLYLNHNINTNMLDRKYLYDIFKNKTWCTVENDKSVVDYLTSIKNHKFILSPDGNGFDCHRTWEALYLGCIPIVQRHYFTEEFAKELPILVIDDYNTITEEFLEYKYDEFNNKKWNWDLLKLSYWRDKIKKEI